MVTLQEWNVLKWNLGEPDESGRRRPVEVKDVKFCTRC